MILPILSPHSAIARSDSGPAIRPYRDGDLAACSDLWQLCGLTAWYNDPARDTARWQSGGNAKIFVAEDGGAVAGSICCGHDCHGARLYHIAVDPAYRGRGLGRELVQTAERWLHKQGILKVSLHVREDNRQVVGFCNALGYAATQDRVLVRWLGLPCEPPPDAILPADIGLAVGRNPRLRLVITYLEMTERPFIAPVPPPSKTNYVLMRAEHPTVPFYRYLYHTVGGDWNWWLRRQLSDDELAGILIDDRVEVFVLYVDGAPAGFFELDRRDEPTIHLAYFGLMPHRLGRGLGSFLLYSAIEQAWSYAPDRLTVNTSTKDHPRALPLYQKMGFVPYRKEEFEIIDPVLSGTMTERPPANK